MYIRVCYTIYVLKVHRRKQEMNNLENFERNIKKMSNDELLKMYASLSYNDIEHPSLRNEAKLDIVTDELLARMK